MSIAVCIRLNSLFLLSIGVEDIVFTIMSSHAEDSPHFVWTKEGDVQTINIDPIVSRTHEFLWISNDGRISLIQNASELLHEEKLLLLQNATSWLG